MVNKGKIMLCNLIWPKEGNAVHVHLPSHKPANICNRGIGGFWALMACSTDVSTLPMLCRSMAIFSYLCELLVTVCYEFFVFCVAKGAYDAHAEKRIEELQARVREMERQNGQLKEKVCHQNFVFSF